MQVHPDLDFLWFQR